MQHSQNTKEKIRQAHIGKPKPSLRGNKNAVGNTPWNKGNPNAIRGEKNPNWRGGISRKIRVHLTLTRDDYTCQICGLRDPDVMEVDHRLPRTLRPDLAQDLANLWTLCANCHKRKTKADWVLIKDARRK